MALAICLYDGGSVRYALKADSFSINYVKTPVQIPLPGGGNPKILDFGQIRPTVTISGLVDPTAPGSSENVSGPTRNSSTVYTVPSKKNLEDFVTSKFYDENSAKVELLLSDGTATPVSAYEVAIQQCRFDLAPATEDRFSFTLVCVGRKRADS